MPCCLTAYITYSVLDFSRPDGGQQPSGGGGDAILLLGGRTPVSPCCARRGAGALAGLCTGLDPRASGGSGPAGRHHHHDRAVLGEPAHCRFQCDCGAGGGYHFYLRAGDGAAGRPDLVGSRKLIVALVLAVVVKLLSGTLLPHQVRVAAPSGGDTTPRPPWPRIRAT